MIDDPAGHHQSGHLKAFESLFDEHRQTQTDTDRQQGFGAKLRVHASKNIVKYKVLGRFGLKLPSKRRGKTGRQIRNSGATARGKTGRQIRNSGATARGKTGRQIRNSGATARGKTGRQMRNSGATARGKTGR